MISYSLHLYTGTGTGTGIALQHGEFVMRGENEQDTLYQHLTIIYSYMLFVISLAMLLTRITSSS